MTGSDNQAVTQMKKVTVTMNISNYRNLPLDYKSLVTKLNP